MTTIFKILWGATKAISWWLLTTAVGLCYMAIVGQYVLWRFIFRELSSLYYLICEGIYYNFWSIFYVGTVINFYCNSKLTELTAPGNPGMHIETFMANTDWVECMLTTFIVWSTFQFTLLEMYPYIYTLTPVDYWLIDFYENNIKEPLYHTFRWKKWVDEIENVPIPKPTDEELLAFLNHPDQLPAAWNYDPKPQWKYSKVDDEWEMRDPYVFSVFTPRLYIDDSRIYKIYTGPENTNYSARKSNFLKIHFQSEALRYKVFSSKFEASMRVKRADDYVEFDIPNHRLRPVWFHSTREHFKQHMYNRAKRKNYI